MWKVFIIAGTLAALLACSDSKKDRFFVTVPMYTLTVEMPDTILLGQLINYTAHASLLGSRDSYSHKVQSVERREISVTLFKDRDIRPGVNLPYVTPISVEGEFLPNAAGTYNFNFWRPEGDYLRREVVVRQP